VEEITQLPVLKPRAPDSNKGDFGRVLVVGGSRGMSGAAILCGMAALRGGAGLVRLAVPESIWPVVAAGHPCLMTAPLVEDECGRLSVGAETELLALAKANDVIALGPGLGRSPGLSTLLGRLLLQITASVVVDADGINAFAEHPEALANHPGALIVTPHPGEFGRLLRTETRAVQAKRRELAVRFAAEHDAVVVLKGHGTIVTDGRRVYQNTTGNPGMATAGTGDVLTGLIAALVGQGLEPFAAAQLGVHLHGLAGDLAREERGEVSLIATDLLDYLPRVFRKL
jgi:ADP-dependent NAD(P)H-hydrate dehydratase